MFCNLNRPLVAASIMIFFVLSGKVHSQFLWGSMGGSSQTDRAYCIAQLTDGSIAIAGMFQGTANFGQAPDILSATSAGYIDNFIARYNSSGEIIWVKRSGGPGEDQCMAIAPVPDGGVVATGWILGSAVFGAGETNQTTLSADSFNIFLARYNQNGTLAWAKQVISSGVDAGRSMTAVDDGFIVSGWVGGSAVFGSGEPNQTTLGSGIYVAKYSLSGALIWARGYTGSNVYVAGVEDNGCLVAGDFTGSIRLGAGEANDTTLNSTTKAMFIARLGANGQLAWARKAGGTGGAISVWSIMNMGSGSALVCGNFSNSVVFGQGTGLARTITSAGGDDNFLARYSPVGDFQWVRDSGGTGNDAFRTLARNSDDGSIIVGGSFSGQTVYNRGLSNEFRLTSAGMNDMVLAKFTPNGEITWVTRDGGTGDDHVFGVLAEPRGRIITTGFAANQVLYRTVDGVPVTLTTYGGEDAFINGYVDPARSNGVNGQDWLMYE